MTSSRVGAVPYLSLLHIELPIVSFLASAKRICVELNYNEDIANNLAPGLWQFLR